MTSSHKKLACGAAAVLLAAVAVPWSLKREAVTAARRSAPVAGATPAEQSAALRRAKEEELARLEDRLLLAQEEHLTLHREMETAEAALAARDPGFRRYREIWDLFRGWSVINPGTGANAFPNDPGSRARKRILWLEELAAVLANAETGDMTRRLLENPDPAREESRLSHWNSTGLWMSQDQPPAGVLRDFLSDPAGTVRALRESAAAAGLPLDLTPEQEAYARDALRSQILTAAARQAMDSLLPPEVRAKQERSIVLTRGSSTLHDGINRLRQELNADRKGN